MVINAIQDLLVGEATPKQVAAAALSSRRSDPDYALTQEEEQTLTSSVLRVGAA